MQMNTPGERQKNRPFVSKIYRHDGEIYVISPFFTIWMDDRYYVRGWSDKRNKPVNIRIDRIARLEVLDEDAVIPENEDCYNPQIYADQVTRMYGDPDHAMEVILRCHSDMVDNVIDRFGPSVSIFNVTPETFDVSLHVAVSGTFLSWLFQFAGSMFIVSPEPARQMYADMLTAALNDMQEGTFRMSESSKWIL